MWLKMVELIGDVCQPSMLVIPFNVSGANGTVQPNQSLSGAIFMSGSKLCFCTGSDIEVITSA